MPKVLVVDDSALMRRLLTGVLSGAGFEVSTARTGTEGVERLTEWRPDVVTLDINMPEMDGITALSLMMQARPTPVVMVSSLTEKGAQATFEALALGAVDYIAKPGGTISLSVDDISEQLITKVRAASRARLRARPGAGPGPGDSTPTANPRTGASPATPLRPPAAQRPAEVKPTLPKTSTGKPAGLVLVGVSTGGPRTLEDILPALPAHFPWPVLVAQHMPASFTNAFARRMDSLCRLAVRECDSTMPLEAGNVYIGRGGGDMVVVERLGRLAVQPRPETAGHLWHPSVDVMVDSALRLMPAQQLVGVQLTGMGNDGAKAMAELRRRGGRTIAESQETAVVFGMPAELIELGGASMVLPSPEIARQLNHWILQSPAESALAAR
jgi:two-component system chemotaxis response regulator CheB